MIVSPAFGRILLFLCAALLLNGCSQFGQGDVDEERESYFLAGKTKKSSLDFKGAIESFEKALEVNPRSAAAHLELGLLFEEKETDYAEAIYHFQKHLKLRPNSNVGEMVKGHINNCKLELAKSIPFALINSKVQLGLDKLNSENLSLRQQVEELKTQLAQTSALTNRPTPAQSNPPPSHPAAVASAPTRAATQPEQTPPSRTKPAPDLAKAARTLRPHKVRSGDTTASIARQYGINYQDILAANPGLDPKRLKSGQTINVPVLVR